MSSISSETKRFLQEKVNKKLAVAAAITSSAIVLAYIYKKMSSKRLSSIPERYPINVEDQSYTKESGERCSQMSRKGKKETKFLYEDAKTLYEAFQRGIQVSENGDCLGKRSGPNGEFEWMSYKEVSDRAKVIGSGLLAKGLVSGDAASFVGLFSANRPEWVICDQAIHTYSLITVPLYDTLGSESCSFIINQTKLRAVLCDTASKAQTLLDSIAETPTLKLIVVFESLNNNNLETAQKHGVEVITLNQLEEEGRRDVKEPVPPKASNVATICYTSGTTGNPKGVVLTHENIVSDVAAILEHTGFIFTKDDYYLSYLPLAHMMERTCQAMLVMHGCKLGFFRGDVKLLLEDVVALRPTLFVTVPRLLNRIYDKVNQGVRESWLKEKLFNLAFSRKKSMLDSGIVTQSTMWDVLIFGKIQRLLGGRVRAIITGSAPLSAIVLDFIRICFGCLVLEGYGQTECTAAATLTVPYDTISGHVGPPITCNRIKLVDVPEMDYYTSEEKGEVCIKGANVMVGYYKDPEKTKETIDEDGWLHTGDIGQWLPNGTLKIIDRKKHIFKLAQGEYLAPEKVENVYVRSSLVAQVFLDGNSLETFPVAVIVPDVDVLPGWAQKHGISKGTMEEMCKNESIKDAVLKDIQKIGKESGLKGFEQAKAIYLHPEPFSLENGFLTPTMKAKRPALRKYFDSHMKELYRQANKTS